MKALKILLVAAVCHSFVWGQTEREKIYETEKAFQRAAAESGIGEAFVEFSAADGLCFYPEPVKCREFWREQPASRAVLVRNPQFIDVSANGVLAYSTGNSIFRPKGKDSAEAAYGQYVTVWQRQPDGNYLAVAAMDILHDKPAADETGWKSPPDSERELNERKISAADYSTAFFEAAARQGLGRAYRGFLADDARLLREGRPPILGRRAALDELKKEKTTVNFAKRTMFVSAADLAYVSNSYTVTDRNGRQTGAGNFLQIWKLKNGKWQIVLDIFKPVNM